MRRTLSFLVLVIAAACAGKTVAIDGASSSSSGSSGASSSGSSGASGETCQTVQNCAKGDPLKLCTVYQNGLCSGASYRVGTVSFPCASCTDCESMKGTAVDYCNSGSAPPPPPPPPPPSDAGKTCAPHAIGSFTPEWHPPASHQNACTQQNIDDFLKYCLGAGDAQGCGAIFDTAAGKACAACILTPATAPTWGPVVEKSAYVSLNTPGCVALVQGNDTCAQSVNAEQQRDDLACASCAVTDQASRDALVECETFANIQATLCFTYARSAECANKIVSSGQCPAPVGGDFATGYNQLAPLFCLIQ